MESTGTICAYLIGSKKCTRSGQTEYTCAQNIWRFVGQQSGTFAIFDQPKTVRNHKPESNRKTMQCLNFGLLIMYQETAHIINCYKKKHFGITMLHVCIDHWIVLIIFIKILKHFVHIYELSRRCIQSEWKNTGKFNTNCTKISTIKTINTN